MTTPAPDRWHRWLHLRPLVESGNGRQRSALACLTAVRLSRALA